MKQEQTACDVTTARSRRRFFRRWRDRNHPAYLMISLFLLLLAQPIVDALPFAQPLLAGLFTLVLLSAVLSVVAHRGQFVVLTALMLPTLVLAWIGRLVETGPQVGVATSAMFAAFLLYLIFLMLRRILSETTVTGNTLIRAVSIYLMIGIAWAFMYYAIEHVDAGALEPLDADWPWADFAFFSFTTMTTLGYGDMVPVSPLARSLAMLQAVLGPLYLTILVAKLVAAYRPTAPRNDATADDD
jgi:hypothetical protein